MLCVGIDSYPTALLAGCVAIDAQAWAAVLQEPSIRRDDACSIRDATRQRVLDALDTLVRFRTARRDDRLPGTPGHGTQAEDLNGDERRSL